MLIFDVLIWIIRAIDSSSMLDTMSWVIGIANPLSALLVGTALALLLSHRPRLALWCSGVGWLVLLVAQLTFLAFGFKSGFPGFRFAQPLMIPVAAANFICWILLRRRSAPRYEYAVRYELAPSVVRQTGWVRDEAVALTDFTAYAEHGETELLRRPVVVIEVIAAAKLPNLVDSAKLVASPMHRRRHARRPTNRKHGGNLDDGARLA